MKAPFTLVILPGVLLSALISGTTLIESSATISSTSDRLTIEQSAFEKREAAYRANNLGAAMLEQYRAKDAVEYFKEALDLKPDLLIARINLSIALYYLPEAEGARREAEEAMKQDPNRPQPHYVLALIARSQNQFDEAIAEFQQVLRIDADDVGANVNLGQILAQQKKYAEAIATFRRALAAEAYNETALYNLGILLTRTGNKTEGQEVLRRFQQLKESGAGTTIGTNYLEGGHYAEAVVSTGLEPELLDRKTPEVKFVDATSSFGLDETRDDSPAEAREKTSAKSNSTVWARSEEGLKNAFSQRYKSSTTAFDFDGDHALDLVELTGNGVRLLHNETGKFIDVTSKSGDLNHPFASAPIMAIAGDYDNDGRTDLFVISYGGLSLYHNDGGGRFSDRTKTAGIPEYPYLSISAAFVDADHDGDLDIFVAGFADLRKAKFQPAPGQDSRLPSTTAAATDIFAAAQDFPAAPNMLLRNNGNGTFTDITAAANLNSSPMHAVAVVPTDFDNRRDVDLLIVNYRASPALFRNQRDGTFREVTREAGLAVAGKWTCVAAGDVNKDGFTDFFFARSDGPGMFALSDGRSHFKTVRAPLRTAGATVAQFVDYDNDGLLDLVTLSGDGVRLWRNTIDSWVETTGASITRTFRSPVAGHGLLQERSLVLADLDNDGDTDVVARIWERGLLVLRNDGGNRNYSVRIDLDGRVSNRSAVEAKVEMRAGSLYQKLETYSASPAPAPADLLFGLGQRKKPDAVRVIWPAGIVQAETEFQINQVTANVITMKITELDRKPSSCPYLYAWNGERFEFVTDFMGGGEMGYLEEPRRYNKPDPEEYVRIPGNQLKEKNGRYELRVTNELEEALFVDRLQLIAVAHPEDTAVYPNEGMSSPPKPFKLFVTRDARPPLTATDDHGDDVLDLITRIDRRWPDNFKLDRIRGYAGEHSLVLKLTEPAARRMLAEPRKKTTSERQSERLVLLLTGWTDYAWSSDNVAAAQAGKAMMPPALQVKDGDGIWRTVIADIGIPVGRPQTVTVDLTGRFLSRDREVRLVTNMRIYWDQILVATPDEEPAVQISRLDPVRADLHWRGFSAETTPDGHEPQGYDYARVSFSSPWKAMTGKYTREGDVRELLAKSDDMFVLSRPGDEISLSFDAHNLPLLPPGWKRTFLLYADGFSKEMDINSASPDQLNPLPFHAMSRYPYFWPEHYPMTPARRRSLETYNTRVVSSPVQMIDAILSR